MLRVQCDSGTMPSSAGLLNITMAARAMTIKHSLSRLGYGSEHRCHATRWPIVEPCLYFEYCYGSMSLLAELACNLPEGNHIFCVS